VKWRLAALRGAGGRLRPPFPGSPLRAAAGPLVSGDAADGGVRAAGNPLLANSSLLLRSPSYSPSPVKKKKKKSSKKRKRNRYFSS